MKLSIIGFAISYFLLLVFNIWFFLIRTKESLTDKITFLLQIIAIYTFAFGVLAQTGILHEFEELAKAMTSSDLFQFLAGNFRVLGLIFSAETVGLSPAKVNLALSYPLEFIVLILMFIFTLLFTILYLVVVLPLAYVAYVIVSIPVNAIMTSANDVTISMGGDSVTIKNIVAENTVTIKNILVAVPSFSFSVTLKIIQRYRKSLSKDSLTQKIKDWLLAHIKTRNIILLVLQMLIIFLIAGYSINMISILILSPIDFNQAGEVIGVVLISILILLVLILLYLKVHHFRKNIRQTSQECAQK